MFRENQEKMLQTLMFIQQMQMKSTNEASDLQTEVSSGEQDWMKSIEFQD